MSGHCNHLFMTSRPCFVHCLQGKTSWTLNFEIEERYSSTNPGHDGKIGFSRDLLHDPQSVVHPFVLTEQPLVPTVGSGSFRSWARGKWYFSCLHCAYFNTHRVESDLLWPDYALSEHGPLPHQWRTANTSSTAFTANASARQSVQSPWICAPLCAPLGEHEH